jgi:hypothetical protein
MHFDAWADIGNHQNCRKVFWINDLSATRHLNDKVFKRWAQNEISRPFSRHHFSAV